MTGGGNGFAKVATLQGIAAGDMVKVMLSDDGAGAVSGDITV